MNQFLQIIGENHVLRAAMNLLANPVPGMEDSRTWEVNIEGHAFPTKALIRRAYCYAANIDFQNLPTIFYTDGFTTQRAVGKLEALGFECQRL
ncbi:hypothetical protein [Spirosoma jeollabukense]